MNRALGYGLVLLTMTAGTALAAEAGGVAMGGGSVFFATGPTVHGPQGYLGVDLRDVGDDQLTVLKLKEAHGAEITLVDHDAPAGKAGLREHDVVLQMNGTSIDGADQISRMLHESPPGRTIVLVISRDGQQMTVTTQMAKDRETMEREAWERHLTVPEPQTSAPPSDSGYVAPSSPSAPVARSYGFLGTGLLMNPSYTGAALEKMTTQLASFFGVPSGAGLLVRSVIVNSPAELAGMRAGDVVVQANSQRVMTTNDWYKAIKNSHGRPLTVVVMRDKKEQKLTLTPDGKKRSSLGDPDGEQDHPLLARLGMAWLPRL